MASSYSSIRSTRLQASFSKRKREREKETSKGIRPLRLSGMLSDGLSYKCSIENLPWVGYRRVSVTSSHEFLPHAVIVFFFSFPYRDDRKFRPPLHKITSRQNIASISHQIPNSRPTRFHFPFSRNEKYREPPPTSTDQP